MGMPERIGGGTDALTAQNFAELVALWVHRSKKNRGQIAELMNKRGYKRVSGTAVSNWGLGERPDLRNAKGFADVMADLLKLDPDETWAIVQSLVMPMYLGNGGDNPPYLQMPLDVRGRYLKLVRPGIHDT